MAETVVLDSEALNALAHPKERGVHGLRARAVLKVAYETGALVRVPAVVLAEVCRSPRQDAAVNQLLNSGAIVVADVTREIAQAAGHLLARLKLSSAHAVDAFVVATAGRYESAVIATGDASDLRRLVGSRRNIRILEL
ncbi:MAG: PIN domain-containing protein [Polyangiaceae bacterium]|nr:PIN domain-containing protein [Polyangiaceae bacterium]